MITKPSLLTNVAYKIFGEKIRNRRSDYYDLSLKLKQAHIPLPVEMYVASAKFFSLLMGLVGALMGLVISIIIIKFFGLPEGITNISLSREWWWLLNYKEIIFTIIVTAILAIFLALIIYMLMLMYPSMRASDRKSRIDRNLPYAITFMYALSKGGMNIIQIFRSISNHEEVYDEVSREAKVVLREMSFLGTDLRTALANLTTYTPSELFQEFLHGLITIIDSGGDVTHYLSEKMDYFFEKALIEQKGFLETLAMMAESYVTAFVAGPLFLIVIQTIMLIMGSGNPLSLVAIIYLMVPVGSIMFLFVIKIITPGTEGTPPMLRETWRIRKPRDIPEEYEKEIKKIRKKVRSYELRRLFRNPLALVRDKPVLSFSISVPVALLFILFNIMKYHYTGSLKTWIGQVDDYIFLGVFIAIFPFALFYEMKNKKDRKVMRMIPDFLGKLASTNESGMTLYQAIRLIGKTDTSPLRKQIEKIWKDIEWGTSLTDAFVRFANRLKVFSLSRTITLLIEAMKSSGNVTEVLMISAKDASNAEIMRKERATNMFIYVIIIYISFFVFIGIVYILSSSFLSVLAQSSEQFSRVGSAAGSVGGLAGLASFDYDFYKMIFMHAAVLQGISSGLVAGVMGEGSVSSGFKHSAVMLLIGYLLFTVFI